MDLATLPKIILWSAMEDEQLASEGQRLGLPVVSKSTRPSVLVDMIEQLVRPS